MATQDIIEKNGMKIYMKMVLKSNIPLTSFMDATQVQRTVGLPPGN